MAEGLLRELAGDWLEVHSAGTEPGTVHPLAVRVMTDHGIDISRQESKPLARFAGEEFEAVITVCDRARESCPIFPGSPQRIHWSIEDPAAVEGSEEERRAAFERAAGELASRIRSLVAVLRRGEPSPPG
jgi:arsenate reductase